MEVKFLEKPYKKEQVEELLHPLVREWFFSKYRSFSEPQLYGVKEIHERNNILISAPTGGTKTLTAFLSIINELVSLSLQNKLEDKVYAIYISPLKALSRDIEINLQGPLDEIKALAKLKGLDINIRIGVRTGDTTPSEKQKMLKKVPHILITTPESLAIMLMSYKFYELLRGVQWCIIDEIHALAENKRGVHLNLLMEHLNYISPNLCRIGLSATVEPIDEIARYLVGPERDCKIANVHFSKNFDLKVISPLPDLIDITFEDYHKALYNMLDKLIQEHKTTLIFTNTRAGTERVVHHLKTLFPAKYTENIGAHHGSLSKKHRLDIENNLKNGNLKAVVCSTSLELGIDIGYIDLVLCLGSPKSVARFLQRCLPHDSKILLADGTYKKIGEIVENKLDVEVLSFDEKNNKFVKNKIKHYHKNKTNKLLEFNLHSGLKLECTSEHPLFTREGWKKAKEINEGEEIAELFDYNEDRTPYIFEMINKKEFYVENREDFLRGILDKHTKENNISYSSIAKNIGIKENHLQNYLRKKGRKKSIRLDLFLKIVEICGIEEKIYINYLKELKTKSHHRKPIPLKLNEELMWLAGIVASDGSISYHKQKKYYHIKIGNKDKNLLEECKTIYNKYGFEVNLRFDKKREIWCLDCGSKILAELFVSLGLKVGKKSFSIEVSNELYKLSKKLIVPYIEGVLEGDGNVSGDIIRIFTASKEFAIGMHNLLNKSGIFNYFEEQEAKTSEKIKKINSDKIYCLYVARNKHIKTFLENCICLGKKIKKLKNKKISYLRKDNDIQGNISWVRIKSIKSNEDEKFVYNITLENEPNDYFVDSILTHNCGRAGHGLHETVKGRVIVTDRDDLVECSVLLKNAIDKKIDKIHIPVNALDVLAQVIHSMAVANIWNVDELYKLLRKSYCYKDLTEEDFFEIIKYLAGKYVELEERYIYGKIWFDEESREIGKKGKMSRVINMTNVGTIPDETSIKVKIGDKVIGTLDEAFLERLKRGDIFVIGGDTYEYLHSRGMSVQVRSAAGRSPTIPSWFSEMLPLSFDLALEIQRFRRLMEEYFKSGSTKKDILNFINNHLYVDENAANAIYKYFKEQYLYSTIPNDKKIVVEYYTDEKDKTYVIFHTLFGRRVNDVLSRAVAYNLGKIHKRDLEIGISDNGFFVASTKNLQAMRVFTQLDPSELKSLMEDAIEKTEILKRRFRHCAMRALMILKEYKGVRKNVGMQQVSSMILLSSIKRISNDFCILKEARREVLDDLMDLNNAKKILEDIKWGKIKIKETNTALPSPFAFGLITNSYMDLMRMEDRMDFINRMHQMILAKIGKENEIGDLK
nr:hypothetical protein [Nanoarchaeum sp.]